MPSHTEIVNLTSGPAPGRQPPDGKGEESAGNAPERSLVVATRRSGYWNDPDVIRPAVDAARRVLRNLDPDDVPPRLRRVAGYTDRALPAPLLRTLLDEVDSNDWLRDKITEEWAAAHGVSEDAEATASEFFLRRPAGWEERIIAEIEATSVRTEGRKVAELEREIDRLADHVSRLSAELDECRRRGSEAISEAARRGESKAGRLGEEASELRRRLAEVEAERDRTRQDLAEASGWLAEADRKIDDLRSRLARGRRAPDETAGSVVFGRGRPLAAARALDDLVTALSRAAPAEERTHPPARVALPPPLRPDDAEAIGWLLSQEGAFLVLVDGYNVAHTHVAAPDADTRRRVEEEAARLRRLADGTLTVVVLWDSAVDGTSRRVGGIEVRYVPSADEAIIATAREATLPVVVVSSDRRVREESEVAGAIGLWATAWTGWR